eukprot:GHVN01035600.1.p1 GENE.GHVN01035600.1~~GHVN01035600.1.p1  ORF type:complete len:528 (+),score=69.84 GHVN01035600.1:3457-5040(+)
MVRQRVCIFCPPLRFDNDDGFQRHLSDLLCRLETSISVFSPNYHSIFDGWLCYGVALFLVCSMRLGAMALPGGAVGSTVRRSISSVGVFQCQTCPAPCVWTGAHSSYQPQNRFATPTAPTRFFSSRPSFISKVLEQVKKDIASSPELQQEVDKLRKKSKDKRSSTEEAAYTLKQKVSAGWSATSKFASSAAVKISKLNTDILSSWESVGEKHPSMKKGHGYATKLFGCVGTIAKKGAEIGVALGRALADAFASDSEDKARERNQQWRDQMAARQKAEQTDSDRASQTDDETSGTSETQAKTSGVSTKVNGMNVSETLKEEFGLVLVEETAWDKFGSKLRDNPFLERFWGSESPVFSKIFGETEQGAALRDMKAADPSFRLPEFVDLFEHVIAPHMLHCYLEGDIDSLRAHCGDAAFGSISATIKERKSAKLTMDPTVLMLRRAELQGITRMDESLPWFVFTFSAQQINCLRNEEGKIIMGAVDDIREVVYSVAVSKHPEPTADLQYPWMVREMAIVGNTPTCWIIDS